ncbi:MAG: hypothetical protein JWN98_2123 [Abditibacteriota bacterium]|nr:hypothetical protein [Abditibacteriota bacterium]
MLWPAPSQVQLTGWLGARVSANEMNRLLVVDEDELLDGFRHRPGKQEWIGEHVGKFLHAATLAWANTGDERLRVKIDRVARELIKTQETDGYIGTYTPAQRWTSWDVWVHKYALIGLLTHHRYTGELSSLQASRKIGDLLVVTFPAQKSLIAAGTHVGMASTSVLEPIVLLYRTTGDAKYLQFARYIVASWEEVGGPKVLSSLLSTGSVRQTANAKAYEMLSNLVGLCELLRVTGDASYLQACETAWTDIVKNQLYITGTASHREHFGEDGKLPNEPNANVGETCVTVTWIQLNSQLLRLTGKARYGDELERSVYNHLLGAQRPDGSQWCYYTPLEGRKPYGRSINCCLSSGPRGVALTPQLAYFKYFQGGAESLAVNFFESSRAKLMLAGQAVEVEQRSGFPRAGQSEIVMHLARPTRFGLKVRVPSWAAPMTLQVGQSRATSVTKSGWLEVSPRRWQNGDRVRVQFRLTGSLQRGTTSNSGRAALRWGPLVLAYDSAHNTMSPPMRALAAISADLKPEAPAIGSTSSSMAALQSPLRLQVPLQIGRETVPRMAVLVPFAEAGRGGEAFRVWLRAPGVPYVTGVSLAENGEELLSRNGNVMDSFNDGDTNTFAVTFDTNKRDEDWFALVLPNPITLRRVLFAHGKSFHDGGWFDSSRGKPRVQVQKTPEGEWETLGELNDYPQTTATSNAGLRDGQTFSLQLPEAASVTGLRVIGHPASGDNPAQSFSSCAELQAFEK